MNIPENKIGIIPDFKIETSIPIGDKVFQVKYPSIRMELEIEKLRSLYLAGYAEPYYSINSIVRDSLANKMAIMSVCVIGGPEEWFKEIDIPASQPPFYDPASKKKIINYEGFYERERETFENLWTELCKFIEPFLDRLLPRLKIPAPTGEETK